MAARVNWLGVEMVLEWPNQWSSERKQHIIWYKQWHKNVMAVQKCPTEV